MACRKTLADLGVDYLDLYFIHFPIALKFVPIEDKYPPEWINYDPAVTGGTPKMILDYGVTYQQTYHAMEELVRKGLVRNIGISNVNTTMIRQCLSYAQIKPASLQVEMHPYFSQEVLLRMARENGLQVMAFSNFGPISYVELDLATNEETLLVKQTVTDIAAAHNKTPA